MVNINASFNLKQKSQIIAGVDDLEQAVTIRLDHLEQAVRELLHIVCSQSTLSHPDTKRLNRNLLGFQQMSLRVSSALVGLQ